MNESSSFVIEIHPRRMSFDPLARFVRSELIEAGESEEEAFVNTQRLYRLKGPLTKKQANDIAETLLVDPVVETFKLIEESGNASIKKPSRATNKGAFVLDVWLKPGVTDPVGETVEKGLLDLGFPKELTATSGQRYVFPKIKDPNIIKNLAEQILANQLIHDISIRNLN